MSSISKHLKALKRLDEQDEGIEDEETEDTDEGLDFLKMVMREPVGSSGTHVNAGYFSEEYLRDLTGNQAAVIYDKMRRSDPIIKMCLRATKNVIRGAHWDMAAPQDADEKEIEIAEFVKWNLFEGLTKTWQKTLNDLMTIADYGHSVLEIVDAVMFNHPEHGTKNIVRQLGWRSPKSLESWNLNPITGELVSLDQLADGDTMRRKQVVMDAKNLIVLTIDQEGDNYEGESLLRSCYGSWLRKQLYRKLLAVGIEKHAIPTPKGTMPAQIKRDSTEALEFKKLLKNLVSHPRAFALLPQGWGLEFIHNPFDPEKLDRAIASENQEIVFSFLANFLSLAGAEKSGGGQSASRDLSSFFLGGVNYLGETICEAINAPGSFVTRAVDKNYGPQKRYPRLTCSGITDKAGAELATILQSLTGSKVIRPDDKLEADIRKRYRLPEADMESVREEAPPMLPGMEEDGEDPESPPPGKKGKKPFPAKKKVPPKKASEARLTLAERKGAVRKLIRDQAALLQDAMQEHLEQISDKYISSVMRQWEKLSDSQKGAAVKKATLPSGAGYKRALFAMISDAAAQALASARAEVPAVKEKQLAEFEELPKKVQKKLKRQSDAIVDTQLADIEKAVTFQFQGSVDNSKGSAEVLQYDLEEATEKFIEGSSVATAAGNTASFVVNESRNAFFFDEDTLKEVRSFTFINYDPVSPICQNLAGKTFEYGDPEYERYMPPLHHNAVLTGTLIETQIGPKPIETLKVGELVLTHAGRYRAVTEFMDRFEDKHYFEITLDNGAKLSVTGEHPILTVAGWKRVDALSVEDEIICLEDV